MVKVNRIAVDSAIKRIINPSSIGLLIIIVIDASDTSNEYRSDIL
jgi:hypothetical protein